MLRIIISVNLLVSIGSAVAAVIALIKPAALSGSQHVETGELFYVRMYAARSIPFGLTVGILPLLTRGNVVAWVLFTAAVIQLLDAMIAFVKAERGMVVAAAVAGLVHFLSGLEMIQL